MKYTEEEFEKQDAYCTEQIKRLREAVDLAESESNLTIDGVPYPVSAQWREIAQIALDLADKADWFDRFYYYHDDDEFEDDDNTDLDNSNITPLRNYRNKGGAFDE